MKKINGITLISLIITIIVLLILTFVTISTFNNGDILTNAETAVDKSNISSQKEEIELAIMSKIVKSDRDIGIEDIIEELNQKGIIDDSNIETGQVRTDDGYIYEITEDSNGNWEVSYIGKGEIDVNGIIIKAIPNTTGIAKSVIITITAKSNSGIKSYIDANGVEKSYSNGTVNVEETFEISKNGEYTFTVINNNGEGRTKTVEIVNIIEDTMQISTSTSELTKENVIVTVTWPEGSSKGIKEIQVGDGEWKTYTGEISTIEVSSNCIVKARVRNSFEDIIASTLEITNIDKTTPTIVVADGSGAIFEGEKIEFSEYFTVTANGKAGLESVVYIDTSDNSIITNTSSLTTRKPYYKMYSNQNNRSSYSCK